MTEPKPPIARLLAGKDQLSRVEKEQILAQVLVHTQAEAPSPGRRFGFWVGLLAAASAALGGLFLSTLPPDPSERVARGGGPSFSVSCAEGLPCGPGGRLRWFVRSTPELSHFAAFAQRPDGTILWYFPQTEAGESLDLGAHAGAETGELDVAIELGQEHAPGTYKLIGMFSPNPRTRGALRSAYLGPLEPGAGLVVVESQLVLR
jgi:hypothetical protein